MNGHIDGRQKKDIFQNKLVTIPFGVLFVLSVLAMLLPEIVDERISIGLTCFFIVFGVCLLIVDKFRRK